MKKIIGSIVLLVGAISAKAQSGNVVVFIPKTNSCYEAGAISTSGQGNILELKIVAAEPVEATPDRMKLASDCQKGEFISDETNGGTHNVSCDESVATTCFCTGIK